MDRGRLEILPGVWLDFRLAVFIEPGSILAVADLHLGYAWAQRHAGQMLPLAAFDDAPGRLRELVEAYRPRTVALLGDILHRAEPLPEIERELLAVVAAAGTAELYLVRGNHDRDLERLLKEWRLSFRLHEAAEVCGFRLSHGDAPTAGGGFSILGHEHPAICVSDGAATAVKCPCFLAGDDVLVLPAFSRWAAGGDVRRGRFLSPLARSARFRTAVAVLGRRLLPIAL